jgi:hypothetical protein
VYYINSKYFTGYIYAINKKDDKRFLKYSAKVKRTDNQHHNDIVKDVDYGFVKDNVNSKG